MRRCRVKCGRARVEKDAARRQSSTRMARVEEERDGKEGGSARSCSVGETQPNEAISTSAAPISLCLLHLLSLPTDQTDLQNEFVSVSV